MIGLPTARCALMLRCPPSPAARNLQASDERWLRHVPFVPTTGLVWQTNSCCFGLILFCDPPGYDLQNDSLFVAAFVGRPRGEKNQASPPGERSFFINPG